MPRSTIAPVPSAAYGDRRRSGISRLLAGNLEGVLCRETAIFLILWLGLLLTGRSLLFQDPGTFWHVAVGQYMLAHGEVIRSDPFSFTRGDHPWTAHQWLSECLMAVLHRAGGWDMLLLATATLLAGLYTWIASRLLRAGLHLLPTLLVLAAVLAASAHNLHVRPLVFSLVGMAWTYGLLVDIEAGRRRLVTALWLVPAFVLWANLHAGVLGGIGSLGLVAAGWVGAWLLGKPSPIRSRRDLAVVAAVTVGAVLSVVVGPYGVNLPRAWLRTLGLPLAGLIQEHAPLEFASAAGVAVVALMLAYAALLAGAFPAWPRVVWLLPAVWLVLGIHRVRNAPLLAIVAALAIADMLRGSRIGEVLHRRGWVCGDSGPSARSSGRWTTAAWAALLLGVLVQVAGFEAPLVGRGWVKLDQRRWPVELIPEIRRINAASPEGTRIFNDLDFGGLLIYYAPRLRSFIDDRCALYGRDLLAQYDALRNREPAAIEEWRAKYGFRYALIETGGLLDRHLASCGAWKPLGRSPVAVLYEYIAGDFARVGLAEANAVGTSASDENVEPGWGSRQP